MYCGGDNTIPKGGVSRPEPVCDPCMSSCAPQTDDVVCDAEMMSTSMMEPAPSCPATGPVIMPGQHALFADASSDVPGITSPPIPDTASIYGDILDQLRSGGGVPSAAVDYAVGRPPRDPSAQFVQEGIGGSHLEDGRVGVNHDFEPLVRLGREGLEELQAFLRLSPEEVERLSPQKHARMRQALTQFLNASAEVYGEGTSWGFNGSKALEYVVNRIYQQKRLFAFEDAAIERVSKDMGSVRFANEYGTESFVEAVRIEVEHAIETEKTITNKEEMRRAYEHLCTSRSARGNPLAREIRITGFNLGMNMTDLNKRDGKGGQGAGDRVRLSIRERFNQVFGRRVWQRGLDGSGRQAADNVTQLKNMTFLAMDVELPEAQAAMQGLQRDAKRIVDGDAVVRGAPLPLAGYYEELVLDPKDVPEPGSRKGTAYEKAMEFLGRLHQGEDIASKRFNPNQALVLDGRADGNGVSAKKAWSTSRKLFSMFRTTVPDIHKSAEADRLPNEPLWHGRDVVDQTRLESGDINRELHYYGLVKRHAETVEKLYAAFDVAAKAHRETPTSDTKLQLHAAKGALLGYLEHPPAEVDPARMPVAERFAGRAQDAFHVFRFQHEDGSFVAVKKSVVDVRTTQSKGAGQEYLIEAEIWKANAAMSSAVYQDGPHDPVFGKLYARLIEGFKSRGLDVEVFCQKGGDEFRIKVRAQETMSKAQVIATVTEVADEIERVHENRPYAYTEKTAMPGGKWNGVHYSVRNDGRVIFKPAKPGARLAHRTTIKKVYNDSAFQEIVYREFGVRPKGYEVNALEELPIKRLHVHRLKGGGQGNELYLFDEQPRETTERPETTLKVQFGVAKLNRGVAGTTPDLLPLTQDTLPRAIDQAKASGEKVVWVDGPSFEERARYRSGYRLAHGARAFGTAAVASKLFVNAVVAGATGDADVLFEGIDSSIVTTWAAMTKGAMTFDTGMRVALEHKNLLRKTTKGFAFNRAALGKTYTGWRGGALRLGSTLGALLTVEAIEVVRTGKIDLKRFGNTIALLTSARYITRAMGAVTKLKGIKPGGAYQLFAEFLIMEGLARAEAYAVARYTISERKEALAGAMHEYDEAIEALRHLDLAAIPSNATVPEVARVQQAYADLTAAYESYAEIVRYAHAPEYKGIDPQAKEIERQEFELKFLNRLSPEQDVGWVEKGLRTPSNPRGCTLMKMSPQYSAKKLTSLRATRSHLLQREKDRYGEVIDRANREFEQHMADVGEGWKPTQMHLPFSQEYDRFLLENKVDEVVDRQVLGGIGDPMMAVEMEPTAAQAERINRATFERRYAEGLSEDPYRFTLGYILFLQERAAYLKTILRR